MKYVLGISAFYHDSAATLIKDGEIISAIQEERLTRIKHDSSLPINSIKYILNENKITLNEVDSICFYDKPLLKFERLLETYIATAPFGLSSFLKSMPSWIKDKLFLKKKITKELENLKLGIVPKIKFAEHHLSHAASAFYPSNFKESLILTLDGVGEWATTSISIGKDNLIDLKEEIFFPHSLGLLYSAFTYYLGFKVNSGEYKVMGLAPYGDPLYEEIILKEIIQIRDDGSFTLNQKYFSYSTGLQMISKKFIYLFNRERRKANEEIEDFHMNIAASIQSVTEKIILKICAYAKKKYLIDNICLAGGVALNCVANGKLIKENIFKNVWIQPASGDAGGSLGAALLYWYNELDNKRNIDQTNPDSMKGSLLGPSYSDNFVEKELNRLNCVYQKLEQNDLSKKVAKLIFENKSVGWMQDKMEFGPRSLGNRSILANPLSTETQKNLNLKIKFRESFRPFAPAVMNEKSKNWFDLDVHSPYMLIVSDVKKEHITSNLKKTKNLSDINNKRSTIPAVTHVDLSARVQTVHKEINPKFYNLIEEFYKLSGVPILVNTSFNVRNEPIVCTPEDAFRCFMGSNLDILVINHYILFKDSQTQKNHNFYQNYFEKFELD